MSVEDFQKRAAAAPGWLRGIVIAVPFLLPWWWIVGENNAFTVVLGCVTEAAGEAADFRHVLAYFLCVLGLLIPAVVVLQFVGRARLKPEP